MRSLLTILFLSASLYSANIDKKLNRSYAYLIKDTKSNEIVKSKNHTKKIAPASLTKILTVLTVLENSNLDEVVTITKRATQVEPVMAYFKVGEKYTIQDLLLAALMNSYNDARYRLAIHVGGSIETFSMLMNHKAIQIGMYNSNFTNPAGYDYGEHYSTLEDLMKLTEYSIKNPYFEQLTTIKKTKIHALNRNKYYTLNVKNNYLEKNNINIVKTGYTKKAGGCIIGKDEDTLFLLAKARGNKWNLMKEVLKQY